MKEVLKNYETNMHRFFLSVRKGQNNFGNFDKFEFKLDTSKNIVEQAEMAMSEILDSFDIPETSREDFSWKVFRNQGNGYGMVTKSKNWQGE